MKLTVLAFLSSFVALSWARATSGGLEHSEDVNSPHVADSRKRFLAFKKLTKTETTYSVTTSTVYTSCYNGPVTPSCGEEKKRKRRKKRTLRIIFGDESPKTELFSSTNSGEDEGLLESGSQEAIDPFGKIEFTVWTTTTTAAVATVFETDKATTHTISYYYCGNDDEFPLPPLCDEDSSGEDEAQPPLFEDDRNTTEEPSGDLLITEADDSSRDASTDPSPVDVDHDAVGDSGDVETNESEDVLRDEILTNEATDLQKAENEKFEATESPSNEAQVDEIVDSEQTENDYVSNETLHSSGDNITETEHVKENGDGKHEAKDELKDEIPGELTESPNEVLKLVDFAEDEGEKTESPEFFLNNFGTLFPVLSFESPPDTPLLTHSLDNEETVSETESLQKNGGDDFDKEKFSATETTLLEEKQMNVSADSLDHKDLPNDDDLLKNSEGTIKPVEDFTNKSKNEVPEDLQKNVFTDSSRNRNRFSELVDSSKDESTERTDFLSDESDFVTDPGFQSRANDSAFEIESLVSNEDSEYNGADSVVVTESSADEESGESE